MPGWTDWHFWQHIAVSWPRGYQLTVYDLEFQDIHHTEARRKAQTGSHAPHLYPSKVHLASLQHHLLRYRVRSSDVWPQGRFTDTSGQGEPLGPGFGMDTKIHIRSQVEAGQIEQCWNSLQQSLGGLEHLQGAGLRLLESWIQYRWVRFLSNWSVLMLERCRTNPLARSRWTKTRRHSR